ncbi:MAG: glucosaminidase domain-containing protein [Bacteroidales bacterium]|nr:glucosaminidase domain-containing protein [Bacteroidales bacterium]
MRYITVILLFIYTALTAQESKMSREEYIDTYKELSMQEMKRTGIPASITLAQGILESGNGNSRLARKANNHFGIKCHDWKGKSIRHDDDARRECFRKYKSVEESYQDHSEFLKTRERYAFLFDYSPDDYKSWAKGLKKAGYATSPSYADALIRIIDENELYQYDEVVIAGMGRDGIKNSFEDTEYAGNRKVMYNNRVKYVLARKGDSFTSLAEEMYLFNWQLPKYNDINDVTNLTDGQKIYIQPKRNKAETGKNIHIANEGETIMELSQMYAVKAEKLAARNNLTVDAELENGQEIYLRKKNKDKGDKLTLPSIALEEEPSDEEFQVEFDLDD